MAEGVQRNGKGHPPSDQSLCVCDTSFMMPHVVESRPFENSWKQWISTHTAITMYRQHIYTPLCLQAQDSTHFPSSLGLRPLDLLGQESCSARVFSIESLAERVIFLDLIFTSVSLSALMSPSASHVALTFACSKSQAQNFQKLP